jgi:hypothetical protein
VRLENNGLIHRTKGDWTGKSVRAGRVGSPEPPAVRFPPEEVAAAGRACRMR